MSTLKSRRLTGFTLLELIVVLLVLGVLAAIAVPTFQTVKENSVERAAQSTLESAARNGEAIYATDQNATDEQIATAVEAEFTDGDGRTVTVSGDTVTVTHVSGSITATGSVEFNDGVATVNDAAVAAPGGGSAFQAATTDWSWTLASVSAAQVCGDFRSVSPDTHPDLNTNVDGWEYSIDGAPFAAWLPNNQGLKIWGGANPGFIMFPGPGWLDNADPSVTAMCALAPGQQVQFKTPSGLYSPLLTIS